MELLAWHLYVIKGKQGLEKHAIPEGEDDHTLSYRCRCRPTVFSWRMYQDARPLFQHHAFDARELLEPEALAQRGNYAFSR